MNKHILIVDDDGAVARLLQAALNKNGFTTTVCFAGEEALLYLDQSSPDAAILDIVLPGIDGLEVLRSIRNHSRHCQIPVIMLTSKDSEVETVLGLELGADDYLSKPVRYHELLTRLKKVFSRFDTKPTEKKDGNAIHGLVIDSLDRSVCVNGCSLTLTYLEFELLKLLTENTGKVFTRDNLLDSLWHEDQFYETRTVDVHVRRLRKKLEEAGADPGIIETVRGVGYRMARPDS